MSGRRVVCRGTSFRKKLDIKVPAVLTQLIPQEHVLSLGGLPNSATGTMLLPACSVSLACPV